MVSIDLPAERRRRAPPSWSVIRLIRAESTDLPVPVTSAARLAQCSRLVRPGTQIDVGLKADIMILKLVVQLRPLTALSSA